MAFRINQEAVEHAQNLIQGQQYERNSDWREVQASAEEENRYIDENGWEASALVPKTTMRSKAPLTGCLRSCLAKTTGRSLQRE